MLSLDGAAPSGSFALPSRDPTSMSAARSPVLSSFFRAGVAVVIPAMGCFPASSETSLKNLLKVFQSGSSRPKRSRARSML